MAKKKNTDEEIAIKNKDIVINEDGVKEGKEDVKEDDSKKDDKSKDDEKVYILWYKRNEKDNWNKVDREFKTETSGNNHNIFVTGYEITEVLIKGEQPE